MLTYQNLPLLAKNPVLRALQTAARLYDQNIFPRIVNLINPNTKVLIRQGVDHSTLPVIPKHLVHLLRASGHAQFMVRTSQFSLPLPSSVDPPARGAVGELVVVFHLESGVGVGAVGEGQFLVGDADARLTFVERNYLTS